MKIQYKHVEPLEQAYSQVIARKNGSPTPVPMGQALPIATGILALKGLVDRIDIIRKELVGCPPDSEEHKTANASFGELLEEEVEVELPIIDGMKLEKAGVEVDIGSLVVLKFHDLITYE